MTALALIAYCVVFEELKRLRAADAEALLAIGLEGNPVRRVRFPLAVPVHDLADGLSLPDQFDDEILHVLAGVDLRRADYPDTGREPVQVVAEVDPVVLNPVLVTALGVRDVDEPPPNVLLALVLFESLELPLLALPLILCV